MNELVVHERRPGDQLEEIVETFSTISKIAGKTIWTVFNELSLLKNPPEIQSAIRAGNLPVFWEKWYAFNKDHHVPNHFFDLGV